MTDSEIIAVVSAHKEGKKMQFRSLVSPHLGWITCDSIGWDFTAFEYRVVPEPRKPREWWAEFPMDGGVGQIFTDLRQSTKGGYLVRVREVLG